jgi:PLP dependent protein
MFDEIINELKDTNTRLVAVSKTKSNLRILALYDKGQRIFGENYVGELLDKYNSLPKDIEWHFIGHLQSNKVRYIANFVTMIHSVDSFKLLQQINKEALKHNRIIKCLLQFHIAEETTKFGFTKEEVLSFLGTNEFLQLRNVELCGVMGMATFTDNKEQVKKEFQILKGIFDGFKTHIFTNDLGFTEISMGMSDDYQLAIAEGSTMVRIGSLIFGKRQKNDDE